MMIKKIISSIFIFSLFGFAFSQPVLLNKDDLNYYKIEYELFGGKNNPDNPEKVYIKNCNGGEYNNPEVKYKNSTELKKPTKDGYRFIYWFSDSDYINGNNVNRAYTPYEYEGKKNYCVLENCSDFRPFGSVKLYAKWQKTIDLKPYIKNSMVTMIPEGKKVTLEKFAGNNEVQTIDAYEILKYEVTSELWGTVMHWADPENIGIGGDVAKRDITFYDACKFCNELTKILLGEDECCYKINVYREEYSHIKEASVSWDQTKKGFRLPTRAEWEFAARGGTYGGWDTNGYDKGQLKIHKFCDEPPYIVGELPPNKAGLYDILGNVSEMCWDVEAGSGTNKNRYVLGSDESVKSLGTIWTEKTYIDVGLRIVRSY